MLQCASHVNASCASRASRVSACPRHGASKYITPELPRTDSPEGREHFTDLSIAALSEHKPQCVTPPLPPPSRFCPRTRSPHPRTTGAWCRWAALLVVVPRVGPCSVVAPIPPCPAQLLHLARPRPCRFLLLLSRPLLSASPCPYVRDPAFIRLNANYTRERWGGGGEGEGGRGREGGLFLLLRLGLRVLGLGSLFGILSCT